MYVKVTKERIYPDEPALGSLTEIELMYDEVEISDLQLELMEEGLTEEETLEYDFEVDDYTFRLGDFI